MEPKPVLFSFPAQLPLEQSSADAVIQQGLIPYNSPICHDTTIVALALVATPEEGDLPVPQWAILHRPVFPVTALPGVVIAPCSNSNHEFIREVTDEGRPS